MKSKKSGEPQDDISSSKKKIDNLKSRLKAAKEDITLKNKRLDELQQIFNSVMDAVVIVEVETKQIINVNQKACEMFGYSKDELCAMKTYKLHPAGLEKIIDDKFMRMILNNENVTEHFPALRKDGSSLFVNIKAALVDINDKQCIVGFLRDITPLIEAFTRLKDSEEKYRLVVENADASIAIVRYDGVFIFVNSIGSISHNKSASEIIGKTMWDLFPKDIADFQMVNVRRVIDTNQPYSHIMETIVNNKPMWVNVKLQPVQDKSSNSVCCMVIAIDMTKQKEYELRSHTLSQAVEQSIEGVGVTDLKGVITYINKAFAQMHGYEPEELLNKNIRILHTKEQYENEVLPATERVFSDSYFSGIINHKKKNGDSFPMKMSVTLLQDPSNISVGMIATATDISEELAIQNELKQSEEKYHLVFEEASVPMAMSTPDRKVILINKEFEELSGYTKNESEGKMLWTDRIPDEDKDLLLSDVSPNIRNNPGIPVSYHLKFFDKKGELKLLFAKSVLLVDDEEHRVITSFIDLTQIRKAEESLIKSENKFRQLVDQLPAITYMVIPDEKPLFISPQIKEILGYTPEEFLSSKDYREFWKKIVHPDDLIKINREMEKYSKQGSFLCEYRMIAKDGRIVYIQDSAIIIKDTGSSPSYCLGLLIDITEKKKDAAIREAFTNMSNRLLAPLSLREIGRQLALESRKLFNHACFWVNLYNDEKRLLYGGYSEDTPEGSDEPVEVDIDEATYINMSGIAALQGMPKIINRMEEPKNTNLITFGYKARLSRSLMFVPIMWNNKSIGILSVQSYVPGQYSDKDLELLQTFANQCAGALARAQIERDLRLSEHRYRHITSKIIDYIYTVYFEHGKPVKTEHSPTCESVTGYTADEYSADMLLWYKVIHPDDREFVKTQIAIFYEVGSILPFEHRIIRKNGESRWVRNTCIANYDLHGNMISYDGLIQDITEQKRNQESVVKSEARYRAVVENQTDMICRHDLHGKIKFVNNSFCKYFNVKPDFVIGKSFYDFIPYSEQEQAKINLRNLDKINPVKNSEYKIRISEDVNIWQEWSDRIIYDDKGNFIDYQSVGRDITERKIAEETLKKNRDQIEMLRQQYYAVLRCTPNGLCILDANWIIVYANQSLISMLRSPDSSERNVVGIPFDRFFINLSTFKNFKKNIHQSMISTGSFNREIVLKNFSEEIFWCEISIVRIDPSQTNPGYVATIIDITERKKSEEEKEKIKNEFIQAQKMESIGLLAGGIAHDFNNLLTIIKGFNDILRMKLNDTEILHDYTMRVDEASSTAIDLVRQLLLFSRKEPIHPVPIDLNHSIKTLLRMLKHFIGEDIVTLTDFTPNIWTILADKSTIDQIIMNIALNAKDAMPTGGIITFKTENVTIDDESASKIQGGRAGKFVMISITDTGTGIDNSILPKIFDPFFTTKSIGKGTGLGLSTVYGIVKKHEGFITVDSEVGKGTTFKIYLPLYQLEFEKKTSDKSFIQKLKGEGETILVVEDEDGVRDFAFEALKANDYHVILSSNAENAIIEFVKHRDEIDLVFSDVVLPDKSGVFLIDKLLEMQPELKVFLTSGYTDNKLEWETICSRNYRFLPKPYSSIELLNMIYDVLKSS